MRRGEEDAKKTKKRGLFDGRKNRCSGLVDPAGLEPLILVAHGDAPGRERRGGAERGQHREVVR